MSVNNKRVWLEVEETALGMLTYGLLEREKPRVIFFVSNSLKTVEEWAEDCLFYQSVGGGAANKYVVKLLPEAVAIDPETDSRSFDNACDRVGALVALEDVKQPLIIATTYVAMLGKFPSKNTVHWQKVELKMGGQFAFNQLVKILSEDLGYDNEAVCEKPGQFAVRGGIIDVYPVSATDPYRVDFFGDEVESIQTFDPTTQLTSGEKLQSLVITALFDLQDGAVAKLDEFLPEDVTWCFYEEPEEAQEEGLCQLLGQRESDSSCYISSASDVMLEIFEEAPKHVFYTQSLYHFHVPTLSSQKLGFERFQSEQETHLKYIEMLLEWQQKGYALYIVTHNEAEKKRLVEFLGEHELLKKLKPKYWIGNLNLGCKIDAEESLVAELLQWIDLKDAKGVVVTTDNEIFGRYRYRATNIARRRVPQRSEVDQLLDFSELAEGDYLVHLQHGICKFKGLQQLDLKGKKEEVISLEFADEIQLHVPLHESHLVSRYVGLAKASPKLGKIGSGTWTKTRRAAEEASLDFAAKMLKVQAQRQSLPGFSFGADLPIQKEFEESFMYRETKDQMRVIEEAKMDMEKTTPMDRLLCGDVGFGKTEVAIRAAFKAVMKGKQVAILVPTTVLCQQHFNTFRERMADFPVVVEMLSRFRTAQEQDKIIAQLAAGRIDIVIGTHRILSEDVEYKDLGLVVIDEEHRFGVKHKERLKELRTHVDVLSMSATPIPRTLYMALAGARDLSVIETPPKSRLPIQTFIKHYTPDAVKEAIGLEVKRGGQVFYLHNRVDTIESVAARLGDMLPNVRIGYGHGQMEEGQLEEVMTRFVAGEYDVLVCTTIIESGLDIPNCNTILIEGADKFGLSQLYQLRGRVGRFNRQAYCYLLLHGKRYVHSDAHKRLTTLKQYNQLGSGFKIAMRDLELRGAGNLLGAQQSGHIAGVGFDLYCQLLRQSVARLKGDKHAAAVRCNLRLDFVVVGEGKEALLMEAEKAKRQVSDFEVLKEANREFLGEIEMIEAYLPVDYIRETSLRIDFYRKLAMAESLEAVDKVVDAMVDRFGKLPKPALALVKMAQIRCLAEERGILEVATDKERLQCQQMQGSQKVYIKRGHHFPRLHKKDALERLEEIRVFVRAQNVL
jgi:transcription-repair coupling factor (superfamily II helicase)